MTHGIELRETRENGRNDPRSDAELILAVRAGDQEAFAPLWSRHEGPARSYARTIAPPKDSEDLVSESFFRVLRALIGGGGPDGPFRPYLFSTLRRINIDLGRSYYGRVTLTGETEDLDLDTSSGADLIAMERSDHSAAWRAWASLPEDARTLLWHLVIEEETPAQLAPILGTTPNGVASRAVRARERLRRAYLQEHVRAADCPECAGARERMGQYLRKTIGKADQRKVEAHLDNCPKCTAAFAEVADLNRSLRVMIAPILLGGVLGRKYLTGWRAMARHVASKAAAHGAAATGSAAAAAVTAAVGVAVLVGHGHHATNQVVSARPVDIVATSGVPGRVPAGLPPVVGSTGASAWSTPGQTSGATPAPVSQSPTVPAAGSSLAPSLPSTGSTEPPQGDPSQSAASPQPTAPTTPPTSEAPPMFGPAQRSVATPTPTPTPTPMPTPSASPATASKTVTAVVQSGATVRINGSNGWSVVSIVGPANTVCSVTADATAVCSVGGSSGTVQLSFDVGFTGPSGESVPSYQLSWST